MRSHQNRWAPGELPGVKPSRGPSSASYLLNPGRSVRGIVLLGEGRGVLLIKYFLPQKQRLREIKGRKASLRRGHRHWKEEKSTYHLFSFFLETVWRKVGRG